MQMMCEIRPQLVFYRLLLGTCVTQYHLLKNQVTYSVSYKEALWGGYLFAAALDNCNNNFQHQSIQHIVCMCVYSCLVAECAQPRVLSQQLRVSQGYRFSYTAHSRTACKSST